MSRLGDGLLWYAVMAFLLVARGASAFGPVLRMIAVGVAGVAVYKWLKTRSRAPNAIRCAAASASARARSISSASRRATLHGVCFSIVTTAYYPALAWLVWSFAALAAVSRVVLGLHYPTDVLAGAAIGAAVALGSFALLRAGASRLETIASARAVYPLVALGVPLAAFAASVIEA